MKKKKILVGSIIFLALVFVLFATHTVEVSINFEKAAVPMPKCAMYDKGLALCNLYGGLAQAKPAHDNASCLEIQCTTSKEVFEKMKAGILPNATIMDLVVK